LRKGPARRQPPRGWLKIIPDTGHWIAERLGHPEYTNDIIYRPVVNLRFGAYYLAWACEYLDGNLVSALAGYNAGPGQRRKLAWPLWRRGYPFCRTDDLCGATPLYPADLRAIFTTIPGSTAA
jgi:soluble lytic murein transglycosylase-like protein